MKHLTLTLMIFMFSLGLTAQHADRHIIASSGETMTSGQYSLSWTIGEAVISTEENSNIILNQGFHQMMSTPTAITESSREDMQVYPNPTTNKIHLDLPQNLSIVDLSIHDLQGRKIKTISSHDSAEAINLNTLASGTYILSIYNTETQEVEKRMKIQKIK